LVIQSILAGLKTKKQQSKVLVRMNTECQPLMVKESLRSELFQKVKNNYLLFIKSLITIFAIWIK
jgi:hypothetical protein